MKALNFGYMLVTAIALIVQLWEIGSISGEPFDGPELAIEVDPEAVGETGDADDLAIEENQELYSKDDAKRGRVTRFKRAPGDAQLNFIRELLRKEKKCTQKCGTGIGDVRVWCEISKSEQECRKRNGCRADIRMDGVPNGRPSSRKRCRSRRRRVKEAGTWSSWQEW